MLYNFASMGTENIWLLVDLMVLPRILSKYKHKQRDIF